MNKEMDFITKLDLKEAKRANLINRIRNKRDRINLDNLSEDHLNEIDDFLSKVLIIGLVA